MRSLFKWTKSHILILLIISLLTIIVPITYSYVPQFLKYIIDIVLERDPNTTLTLPNVVIDFFNKYKEPVTCAFVVGIVLLIFQTIRGLMMFLNNFLKGKFAEEIAFDMRTKLFSHVQRLPYSYHNNMDTGDLIQRCTSDIDTIKSFISTQLPEILYIFASVGAGIYQMAKINPLVMLVTLSIFPISLTTSIIYFGYVERKFEEVEEIEAKMTTVLQENVNGVRVVKAFAREKYAIEKFDVANTNYKQKLDKLNKSVAIYWGSGDFLVIVQYAITIFVSIALTQKNLLSTGDIIACLMYISLLVYPIRGLGRVIKDFSTSIVASKRVDEILKEKDEYVDDTGIETPEITGDICFNNVSFKFDDTDKHLLENVTFDIKSGETIAIIGKTGSGKSTIVNLLVRMQEYDSGSITLNGVELKHISKKWVRENIGIILQDPFLYTKSILENIKIAKPQISNDEAYKAARVASVHKDVKEFKSGYDTLVGEKGVTLSGGQKQRIAIARMLVLNKPIMIFDDSLSAVDVKTDMDIRNALKQKYNSLTTIIITHRITTAKEADKIIVLENGKVAAIGNHQQLSQQEGLYKNLWSIQGALEGEFLNLVKEAKNNE